MAAPSYILSLILNTLYFNVLNYGQSWRWLGVGQTSLLRVRAALCEWSRGGRDGTDAGGECESRGPTREQPCVPDTLPKLAESWLGLALCLGRAERRITHSFGQHPPSTSPTGSWPAKMGKPNPLCVWTFTISDQPPTPLPQGPTQLGVQQVPTAFQAL